MSYILLLIGFILVIKGSDWLVNGSSSLAKRLGISELTIGLTVVAFGTSIPELVVNIISSVQGRPEIAIGNILGSNIANILLIAGISAIIFPLQVDKGTIHKGIPFSFLAAIILVAMMNDKILDSSGYSLLSRTDGIILLAFFIIFIYYSASIKGSENDEEISIETQNKRIGNITLLILSGLIMLILGGQLIVDAAVKIAQSLGLSQSLIGLTVVAIGTSIPELATSIVAAMKKKPEIAIGNVVGSNIFNIFFILGISSVIRQLPIIPSNNIDIFVLLFSSAILFLSMFTGKRRVIDRWEGWIFTILYICYVIYLVKQG